MKGFIVRFVSSMVALWLTVWVGQMLGLDMRLGPEKGGGAFSVVVSAAVAVVALGLANAFLGRLIKMAAAPLNCFTFGLFGLVVNALMFLLVGSGILEGFRVKGFLAGLYGSVVMGALSSIINHLVSSRGMD
ncbi:MAG: phage holin family protein [Armatimonadota bacterium]